MHTRIPYPACPLCEGTEGDEVRTVSCARHPLYQPSFPETMRWLRCGRCGHVFVDGYFDDAALAELFSRANPHQLPGGGDVDRGRQRSARQVERVVAARGGSVGGRWLDVGFGDGALLTTAAEFGFEVLGLETRPEAVKRLAEFGFEALCGTLEQLDGPEPLAVISLCDVLEHMPFPRRALARVRMLLQPEGLVLLSTPNLECFQWQVLDRAGANPYWGELEHLHAFGRRRLAALLEQEGLGVVSYAVSERYLAGMELLARRR
jgi:SAM-dependent methyltransferase